MEFKCAVKFPGKNKTDVEMLPQNETDKKKYFTHTQTDQMKAYSAQLNFCNIKLNIMT